MYLKSLYSIQALRQKDRYIITNGVKDNVLFLERVIFSLGTDEINIWCFKKPLYFFTNYTNSLWHTTEKDLLDV